MKNLIENVDLFAHKINFNYKKKSLYHSFFGIGLSLAVYGTMIFFVWYFSKDFFNNANPRVIYQETEFEKNITIKLKDILGPEITFYLEITSKGLLEQLPFTSNQKVTSEKIGEFFIVQTGMNVFKKIIFFNFNVSTYFYTQEDSSSQQIYNKYLLTNKFKWNSSVFSENKSYKTPDMDIFDLKDRKIINITETNFTLVRGDSISFGFKPDMDLLRNVLSLKNTNSKLEFDFKIMDNVINANSEEFFKPYEIYKRSTAEIVDRQFFTSKTENANYGVVGLNNDLGFIMTKEEKTDSLKKNYESMLEFNDRSNILIYNIDINMVMKQYDRIYKKLQNVFADIGGIMNSLILMGNVIIVQFNKKKFDYDLINNVFKIEKNINEKLKIKSNLENLELNLKEIPNNISIVEMNSSRNFLKKSMADKTTNKNSWAEKDEEGKAKVYLNKDLTNRKTKFSIKHQQIETKSLEINEKENVLKDQQLLNDNKKKEKIDKEGQNPSTGIDIFIDDYKSGALFNKPLIYSKSDFFKSFLCCSKLIGDELVKKEKFFNMAQDKIYQYMDVVNHVNSCEKIEKLISIVFNEQQAKTFNFISNRQIIDLETENIDRDFVNKVIDYYKENIKESKMSLIDERIIKSIYPSFSKLIESNL